MAVPYRPYGVFDQLVVAAGCDDFVRKPFQFEEIYDCMARHLGVKYRYQDPKHNLLR
jgi:DNA-binding response OmpR family regulator